MIVCETKRNGYVIQNTLPTHYFIFKRSLFICVLAKSELNENRRNIVISLVHHYSAWYQVRWLTFDK